MPGGRRECMAVHYPVKKKKSNSQDDYYERTSHRICDEIIEQMRSREGVTFKQICQAIRGAYPFGEKKLKPYKIWIRIVVQRETKLEQELAAGT